MKFTGFMLAQISIDPDFAFEYNRWYDLDHSPEAVTLPCVTGVRRYHASPALISQRVTSEFDHTYDLLTLYWLGDDDLSATLKTFYNHLGPGSEIAQSGRLFRRDKVRIRSSSGALRRANIQSGDQLLLSEDAVPYAGHLGVYVETWEGVAEHDQWLDENHTPEVLKIPGVLGVIRLNGVHEDALGHKVIVSLLGDEPEALAPLFNARLSSQAIPSGIRRSFGGCYGLITPLRYEFANIAGQ